MATVLSNWHSVLQAINMASSRFKASHYSITQHSLPNLSVVKIPSAKNEGGKGKDVEEPDTTVPLPQTLVRIPIGVEQEPTESSETKD